MSSQKLNPPPIYDNILQALGNTPLVHLNSIGKGIKPSLLAKVEFTNPGGSVKDRIGITIIEEAEQSGSLKPGGTVVEGTSGNTGVGLAIAAAIKGYKCIFVMPDKMSEEKIRLLRAFGAKVVITPTAVAPDDPRSYYSVSARLVRETPNSILANQYHNPVNPQTHYDSTGPEIWQQTGGKVDVFVAGMGTGGTISGTSKYLKEQNPDLKVVGVDPIGSLLHDYFQTGKLTEAFSYKVEGVGEDFLPSTMDFSLIDATVQVTDRESFQMTRRLVREEGMFCGGSSGLAVMGAVRYIQQNDLGPDQTVVVLLPDSGSRYLSKLFNDDWMRENGFLADDWSQQKVRQLLSAVKPGAKTFTATPSDTIANVVALMKEHDISHIPVTQDGNLVGLVSEIDLLNHMVLNSSYHPDQIVGEIANSQVPTVEPETSVENLLGLFTAGHSVAIVVSRNGDDQTQTIEGILTKIDVLDYLASQRP